MTTIDEPQEIDTGTTDLIATRRGGVLTLTLNCPERRNAMTPAMIAALAAQLHDAETSELVGAVVITGAGAAFCAGGDVKSFNERGGEGGPQATAADPARIADSVRALELGLLNRCVPEDELPGAAFELASRLANGPQAALRAMKANLLNAGRPDLEPAMDLEVGPHMTCGVTDDHRNAVAAFVEKRTPVFSAQWRRP